MRTYEEMSTKERLQCVVASKRTWQYLSWFTPNEVFEATKDDEHLWRAVRARAACLGSDRIDHMVSEVRAMKAATEAIELVESYMQ